VKVDTRYLLGTGLLLVAAGCLLMAATSASSGWTVLLPGFVVAGLGMGIVNPVLASAAISVVPPQRGEMASGANSTFRQVGIATGIAGLGTVFQSQILHGTLGALSTSAAGRTVAARGGAELHGALLGGGVRQAAEALSTAGARDALLHAYRVGFASTLDHLMIIGAVVALVGSVASFALVRQQDFVTSSPPSTIPSARPSSSA